MKHYKLYGSDRTDLILSDKAQAAYSGCDYHIRQYGDQFEIWLDSHREVGPMTADEINEYFEEWADDTEGEED